MTRIALGLTLVALSTGAPAGLPFGGDKLAEARLAPTGADVRLTRGDGLTLSFAKPDAARRLMALQAASPGDLSAMRSIVARGDSTLAEGQTAYLAVLLFERGGGVWLRVSGEPLADGESRLSLAGARQAAFSTDANGRLDWPAVERIWLGLVVDGAGSGAYAVRSAIFSSEPYRPTRPLLVTSAWSVGQDPAVQSTLAEGTGPDGEKTMKYAFKLPGGRHMYAIPSAAVGGDLEGYTHLAFTYRATLPAGIPGLLVMCSEAGGAQYFAEPAPPASADWTTVEIPLATLQLGGWTQDANGRLDLSEIRNVHIGLHGTAAGEGGEGTVEVCGVRFVAK